ncbi:MAG: DUF2512 family protein [Patescibacteria group bacterium]
MRHWVNLLVKFLVTTAVIWLVGASAGRMTFGNAVLSGAVVTVILYFLWDLFLLPAIGTLATAIADGVTAGVILWIMSRLMTRFDITLGGLAAIGIVLAVAEYFLHRWFVTKEQPGEKT